MIKCPTGDQLHETDDPKGGPCSGCLAHVEDMRSEWEADQMEAMRQEWDV